MNDDAVAISAAPAVPAKGHCVDVLIELWWADHFPGSAVARDTAAWNTAFAAKEALKRLLAAAPESVAGPNNPIGSM